jgi:cytochrome o ubiquinol oxidase subunit 2
MQKKTLFWVLFFTALLFVVILFSQGIEILFSQDIAMLFPKGIIALKQRNLLFFVQALMLIVVIPVFIFAFVFTWRYRADNEKEKYQPNWDHNKLAEILWWGIPCLIIFAIGIATWLRTYELDPYKPLDSNDDPIVIQVIALQWKWLFIYPEQQIASLNYLQFPAKKPVRFEITADAPMNSFWIPQLSGQIFAMPRMRTILHIIADEQGSYRGCSANISGHGFSGMHFRADATSSQAFEEWIHRAKQSEKALDKNEYELLVSPTKNNPVTLYRLKDQELFDQIIMKYQNPQHVFLFDLSRRSYIVYNQNCIKNQRKARQVAVSSSPKF